MPRVALLVVVLFITAVVADRAALPRFHDPECARWRRAFSQMPARTLVIQLWDGQRIPISAKLALTDEARRAGFQCATAEEIRTTVILFDFGTERLGAFHMRNVSAPLDIAFVKKSGRIFAVLRMDPSPTKAYGPMGPFRYAIEARAGFFMEKGIVPGASVLLQKSN